MAQEPTANASKVREEIQVWSAMNQRLRSLTPEGFGFTLEITPIFPPNTTINITHKGTKKKPAPDIASFIEASGEVRYAIKTSVFPGRNGYSVRKKEPVKKDQPSPEPATIVQLLEPYKELIEITDTPDEIVIKKIKYLDGAKWTEINRIIKDAGGSWTQLEERKDNHWIIKH